MPNAYNSIFTGGHNDEYDIRITALENNVQNLEDNVQNLEDNFTTLSSTLNYVQQHELPITTITTPSDFNTYQTTGLYIIRAGSNTNYATTAGNNGLLLVIWDIGTPFQLFLGDSSYNYFRKRYWNSTSQAWNSWFSIGESMVPGTTHSSVSITTISTASSSWQTILSGWTAPNNGYLCIAFTGASNTPAAYIVDNTNGFQVRDNGNGGRDFHIWIPCCKGHTYTAAVVYAKTNGAVFYPSV